MHCNLWFWFECVCLCYFFECIYVCITTQSISLVLTSLQRFSYVVGSPHPSNVFAFLSCALLSLNIFSVDRFLPLLLQRLLYNWRILYTCVRKRHYFNYILHFFSLIHGVFIGLYFF